MNSCVRYRCCVLVAGLNLTALACYAQVVSDLDNRLLLGEATAFQEVAESRSIDQLTAILFLAIRRQYGEQSAMIKELSVNALRAVPNHATALGDRIQRFSEMEGTGRKIEHQFMLLEAIGSPEAIAEIARFLHDDRDPDRDLFPPGSGFASISNSFLSSQIVGKLLGDQSPIDKEPGAYSFNDVRAIQEWWDSPAASEFRASLPPARAPIRVRKAIAWGESVPAPLEVNRAISKQSSPVVPRIGAVTALLVISVGATIGVLVWLRGQRNR